VPDSDITFAPLLCKKISNDDLSSFIKVMGEIIDYVTALIEKFGAKEIAEEIS